MSSLEELAQKSGITPPALLCKPQLDPNNRKYIEAIRILHASRDCHAAGLNPIRISEMESYLRLTEDVYVDNGKFIRIIQALDSVYMDRESKKKNNR